MDEELSFPNLIYAGAPKAGSSTICSMLEEHPNVFLPTGNKEVFYFDFNWDKGRKWYANKYRGANRFGCRVDATVWYMRWPSVPERIAQMIPDSKILFVLRDPVKRAWSNYCFDLTGFHYSGMTAEQVLFGGEDPRGILMAGFYSKLIHNWRAALPNAPMKIMFFEEFISNPERFWIELCDFAEIDRIQLPRVERKMSTLGIRRSWLFESISRMNRCAPSASKHLIEMIARHPVLRNQIFSDDVKPRSCPSEIRNRLANVYRDDFESFSQEFPEARKYWTSFANSK